MSIDLGSLPPRTEGEVLIVCGICGGRRAWFAVERHNRSYGKALLWRAARRGDRIFTGLQTGGVDAPACGCPKKAQR